MLQLGYDLRLERSGNVSLLHIAVSYGNIPLIRYLID